MPSKMATCLKEKAVLVAVYVEKPRRRKSVSKKNNGHGHDHHHHHHHHYHHLHVHQVKRRSTSRRSTSSSSNTNRRAELLKYSQRLRESAKSGTSSPVHPPKPAAPAPIVSTHNQPQPMVQIIPSKSKTRNGRAPICMPWKISTPKLFKCMAVFQVKKQSKTMKKKKKKGSGSGSSKAKAIMKSFKAPKKGGFLEKLIATIQKYR